MPNSACSSYEFVIDVRIKRAKLAHSDVAQAGAPECYFSLAFPVKTNEWHFGCVWLRVAQDAVPSSTRLSVPGTWRGQCIQ